MFHIFFLKGRPLIYLRIAPRGLRYAIGVRGKMISELDGIPKPPRGIQIVERGDPY